jgi:Fe-S-cluster containining protein
MVREAVLMDLEARKQQESTVPCGTCHACCKQDRIILHPQLDDLSAYKWHEEDGFAVLDRKPSGECVYLTASGCSIHGRAPVVCRRFDCRVLFLTTPKARRRERVQENPTMADVYAAARSRLKTLEA